MSETKGERGAGARRSAQPPGRWLLAIAVLGTLACQTTQGNFTWVEAYRDPRQGGPYVISVGDSISIRVFNQDGMSGPARVRPDGMITVALIGDVEAAGQTPAALARRIQARLKEVLVNPAVTVSVDEVRPIEIAVLGEVQKAGVYRLERGSGVLAALAAAGDLKDLGTPDAIFVIRDGTTRIRFTWQALEEASEAAAGFQLRAGDVIIVE